MKKPRLPRSPVASVDPGRLLSLVDDFERTRVVVFGDLIVDEFIYGELSRVSREAPVLILDYDSTEIVPGGAGNAASNVSALGGAATAVGAAGRDDTGRRLLDVMRRGVDVRSDRAASRVSHARPRRASSPAACTRRSSRSCASIAARVPRFPTPTGAPSNRVCWRRALAPTRFSCPTTAWVWRRRRVVARARARLKPKKAGRPPTLIDSRYALLGFRGMTACTPNESEVEHLLGVRIGENARILEKAGRELLARTRSQAVLVTRGSRGMAVFERDQPTIHIPIFGSDQIADVTGAGDTVIATMTLALAAGATFLEAARLANYAGGLVVMKRGTATVSADELRQAILSDT